MTDDDLKFTILKNFEDLPLHKANLINYLVDSGVIAAAEKGRTARLFEELRAEAFIEST